MTQQSANTMLPTHLLIVVLPQSQIDLRRPGGRFDSQDARNAPRGGAWKHLHHAVIMFVLFIGCVTERAIILILRHLVEELVGEGARATVLGRRWGCGGHRVSGADRYYCGKLTVFCRYHFCDDAVFFKNAILRTDCETYMKIKR